VAALEDIPYRKAVEVLSEGVEVSLEEDVRLQLELLDKKLSQGATKTDIAQTLLALGTRCRYYLESVEYAETEVEIVDKFYETIDNLILDFDFDAITECFMMLSNILRLRRDKFEQIRRANLQRQYQEQ
jgi:hypothetical protein